MPPRRRARTRTRVLRSPIEPGSITVNWKLLAFLIPVVGIIGTWAVSQRQIQEHEHDIKDLQDEVAALVLENAAGAGNGAVLEKVRSDVADIKVDIARLRAKLE